MSLCALLAFGLAARTSSLVPMWESDETLWAHAVAVDPSSADSWINLGKAQLEAGALGQAKASFVRASVVRDSSRFAAVLPIVVGINVAIVQLTEGEWTAAEGTIAGIAAPKPWPVGLQQRADQVVSWARAKQARSSS